MGSFISNRHLSCQAFICECRPYCMPYLIACLLVQRRFSSFQLSQALAYRAYHHYLVLVCFYSHHDLQIEAALAERAFKYLQRIGSRWSTLIFCGTNWRGASVRSYRAIIFSSFSSSNLRATKVRPYGLPSAYEPRGTVAVGAPVKA